MKAIKTITSHVGLDRFMADLLESGEIERIKEIPSPYSSGPTMQVFTWEDKLVVISEVSHKRYQVFEVPDSSAVREPGAIENEWYANRAAS